MSAEKNKPVIMFPLRLEICDHIVKRELILPDIEFERPKKPGPIHLPIDNGGSIVIKPKWPPKRITKDVREVLVRWYPDECQIFPAVGNVSSEDLTCLDEYVKASEAADDTVKNEAWSSFVSKVGLNRARYLLDCRLNDIDPISDDDKPINSLFEKGMPLKLLPQQVELYAIKRIPRTVRITKTITDPVTHASRLVDVDEVTGIDTKVDFVGAGAVIPGDLVVSPVNNPHINSRWMIDFNEAEKKGMALRITDVNKLGLIDNADWLVALGFEDKPDSQKLLEELLIRYKAAGGLDILSQDTPTNNTETLKTEFVKNQYGTKAEKTAPQYTNNNGTGNLPVSGDIISSALGINMQVFSGITNAKLKEQSAALVFNRLLWYACTSDYYFYHMSYDRAVIKGQDNKTISATDYPEHWRFLTERFKNYVLGRGLIPSIRIGDNPYGILPVTDIDSYAGEDKGIKGQLEESVKKLCNILKTRLMSFTVPGLAGSSSQSDSQYEKLLSILQLNPVPHRIDLQRIAASQDFDNDPRKLTCPLVCEDDLKRTECFFKNIIEFDYINEGQNKYLIELLNTVLHQDDITQGGTVSTTSLLMRLLQYSAVSLDKRITGVLYDKYLPSSEKALRIEMIKEEANNILQAFKEVLELELPVQEQEHLLKELLDCLSSRLDAWITSFANSRLFDIDMRKHRFERNPALNIGQKENIIGVYGLLEKPTKLKTSHESDGYFQAPSMNQAAAGAVLRNAALVNKGTSGAPYQINLSSERVRKAIWFTQGLQKGYTAAELFGYQIERKIHEKQLDKFILALRKRYFLEAQDSKSETKVVRVINGEKFISFGDNELETDLLKMAQEPGTPPMSTDDITAFKNIKYEVTQIRDAVADLYTAEAVYNTIKGNAPRAAAWLDVAEGKLIPPNPESMDTPRSGHSQMQRFLYPLDISLEDEDYKWMNHNPRYMAEPYISKYCAKLLRNYDQIRFMAILDPVAGGAGPIKLDFLLKDDLGMDAIDLVVGGTSELIARAKIFIVQKVLESKNNGGKEWDFLGEDFFLMPSLEGFEEKVRIDVQFRYITISGNIYYTDVIDKINTLRLFLKSVQPLGPDDFETADIKDIEGLIQSKLQVCQSLIYDRLDNLSKAVENDLNRLEAIKNKIINSDARTLDFYITIDLVNTLYKISKYGIPEAMVFAPGTAAKQSIYETLDIINTVIEKLCVKAEALKNSLSHITLGEVGDMAVKLENGELYRRIDDSGNVTWVALEKEQTGVRLAAANKYLKECVTLIKKWTSEALPVFPAFKATASLSINPKSDRYVVRFLDQAVEEYANVRKNLRQTSKGVLNDSPGRINVYSNFGIKLSADEIKLQAIMNASLVDIDDITDLNAFYGEILRASQVYDPSPAKRVWYLMGERCRNLLDLLSKGGRIKDYEVQAILDRINSIIKKRNLYDVNYFKGFTVPGEAQTLLAKGLSVLSAIEIVRFNRCLLETVFNGIIKKQKPLDSVVNTVESLDTPPQCFIDYHYILPVNGMEIKTGQIIAGFKVDEWTDFLPNSAETTAIAFKFESPRSQAPQAILVAVTPVLDDKAVWQSQDLAKILASTIDLIELRSVPTEKIIGSSLGYILPALLFENPKSNNPWFLSERMELEDVSVKGNFFIKK